MNIKRRDFLGFFLLGGLASLVLRKLRPTNQENIPRQASTERGVVRRGEREAMFWRKIG